MKSPSEWDEKYRESEYLGEPSPFLLQALAYLPPSPGRGLDVASGLGANALALAAAGFGVDALDWSFEASRKCAAAARHRGLVVRPLVCDVTRFPLPRGRYDVVMSFRFLERSLWTAMIGSLRPGGALIVETFNLRHLERRPDFPREYLLEEGELLRAFAPSLRVVRYEELPSESTASLLALRGSRAARRGAAGGS